MTGDRSDVAIRYAAWRSARLVAMASVPIGAASILGTVTLALWGAAAQSLAISLGAVVYALAQIGVVVCGYLLFRARGAFELLHRWLYWMAVAGASGLAATAACTGVGFSSGAASITALYWSLVPAVPSALAFALAGLVLILFRRAWQDADAELRAAETS